ncbi:1026_t:CDS:2 [Ambispora gerdemannii]|uniref:1026_t:CDS:1 n=1 Tax=Ambispora gerdemannii TaxID=144530 RepID=A0A9N8W8L8_9GLOM|nr:1026_t:CDS:2 [Ambispora gerdemannii]
MPSPHLYHPSLEPRSVVYSWYRKVIASEVDDLDQEEADYEASLFAIKNNNKRCAVPGLIKLKNRNEDSVIMKYVVFSFELVDTDNNQEQPQNLNRDLDDEGPMFSDDDDDTQHHHHHNPDDSIMLDMLDHSDLISMNDMDLSEHAVFLAMGAEQYTSNHNLEDDF